ncbi:MAG: hypothetical protein WCP12_14665 [bacterium]
MAKRKAKKVSKAKQVPDNPVSVPASSPPDTQTMLEDVEYLSFIDGKCICRQRGLVNEHNPDGLSLQAIECEIDYAFDLHGDEELLMDQIIRESGEDAAFNIRLVPALNDSVIEKSVSLPTPDHLIQSDDSRLADLISAAPLALLRSFNAQDALARWTYAERYGHDPDTREKAKKFLAISIQPVRGNPGKAAADLPQLLQAYDDCCAYVKLIYKYAIKLARQNSRAEARRPEAINNAVKNLLNYFADADKLGDCGVNLSDIVLNLKGPEPSKVAAEYIGHSCGLTASRVMDLVTKARNKTRGQKTKSG